MIILDIFIHNRLKRKLVLAFIALLILSCENEGINDTNQPPTTEEPDQPPTKDGTNQSPIANAGPDQGFTLPKNSTMLDGSGSNDPGGIIGYNWRKIDGPDSFTISNPESAKTSVNDLIEGIYEFELKVTNTNGLIALDSVKIGVFQPSPPNPAPTASTPAFCDNSNRPKINAQLNLLGSLSKSRWDIAIASVGNKILFAGGIGSSDCPECWGSSRVDIYDTVTNEWLTTELSEGRHGIATAVNGTKVFFAGGANGDGAFDTLYSTVDIYDASTGGWSTSKLSLPRAYIGATAVGNKVLFAGGEKDWDYQTTNVIDIYDLVSNTWSTSTLSEARAYISGVSINGKAYFAGGQTEDRWYAVPSNKIDIYDSTSGVWSTSTLSQTMGFPSGISTDDNIYWASGCNVEIKNTNTWSSTMANLFSSGDSFFNKPNAVEKDGKIIFLRASYNGTDKFDIYDTISGSWSIGVLPQKLFNTNIITLNNEIYVTANTSVSSSVKLWKLEF